MRSADDKCFVRFPEEVAEKVSELVAAHNYFTAGGRIRFRTTSSYVAIKTTSGSKSISTTTSVLLGNGFDLYTKRGETVIFIDGYTLFGDDMRDDCTVDLTHPNDLGMVRMAEVIGKAVEHALSM